MADFLKQYEKGKSRKIKLLALCIKAMTGIVGGSLVLSNEHPYLSIMVLSIGAVADEIVKFFSGTEETIPDQP